MTSIKAPCYNRELHQDCPRRSARCRLSCPEWEVYQQKRDAEYKKQHKRRMNSMVVYEYREKTYQRVMRGQGKW